MELEAIEKRAERALADVPPWIWDGETLPVPVGDIADSHFGLHIRRVEEMTAAPGCPPLEPDQSLSGLLLAAPGEIWVNGAEAEEWPGRERFTICHELGHWVLHRAGQQALFCRRASVTPPDDEDGAPDTRPPIPVTEEEANVFAAELLIPARLLRHHYRHTTRDFEELCEMFGASQRAMSRRLHAVI